MDKTNEKAMNLEFCMHKVNQKCDEIKALGGMIYHSMVRESLSGESVGTAKNMICGYGNDLQEFITHFADALDAAYSEDELELVASDDLAAELLKRDDEYESPDNYWTVTVKGMDVKHAWTIASGYDEELEILRLNEKGQYTKLLLHDYVTYDSIKEMVAELQSEGAAEVTYWMEGADA